MNESELNTRENFKSNWHNSRKSKLKRKKADQEVEAEISQGLARDTNPDRDQEMVEEIITTGEVDRELEEVDRDQGTIIDADHQDQGLQHRKGRPKNHQKGLQDQDPEIDLIGIDPDQGNFNSIFSLKILIPLKNFYFSPHRS